MRLGGIADRLNDRGVSLVETALDVGAEFRLIHTGAGQRLVEGLHVLMQALVDLQAQFVIQLAQVTRHGAILKQQAGMSRRLAQVG